MNKFIIIVATLLIAACSQSTLVQAKPSGPISIEYDIPKSVTIGDVVTTTVKLKSTIDLQKLTVSFISRSGLTIQSGGSERVLTNIKASDITNVEFTIILDDLKGYAGAFIQGIDSNGTKYSINKVMKYGSGTTVTNKITTIKNNGDSLILMPAEVKWYYLVLLMFNGKDEKLINYKRTNRKNNGKY